jgi:two-component system cell cycle sensor histidine kinase/response regulator CckA
VIMPEGVSGVRLAQILTAQRPQMKTLFMSGYTDNAIAHHGVLDSGHAFLQKPFTAKLLARTVYAVLHNQPKDQLGSSKLHPSKGRKRV